MVSVITKIAQYDLLSTAKTLSPVDEKLRYIVHEAHLHHFSTKGDFARRNADYVAMAASMQLITTRLTGNLYSREWRPTPMGIMWLDQTTDA